MNSDITVRDNAESGSYEAVLGEQIVGMIVYERRGNRMIFRHTIVEPAFRRRGIATDLVKAALDELTVQGMTLTNHCGFIADFIAANPRYADLADAVSPGKVLPYDARHREQRDE